MEEREPVDPKLIHYVSIDHFLDWLDNGLFLPNKTHFSQSELDRKGDVASNLFFKSFMIDAELEAYHCGNFAGRDAVVIETTVNALDSWFGRTIETDRGPGHCTHRRMDYFEEKDQIKAVRKMSPVERIMWLPMCFSVEEEYRIVVQVPQVPSDDKDTDHARVRENLTGLFHTVHVLPASRIPEVDKRLLESGVVGVKVLEAKLK